MSPLPAYRSEPPAPYYHPQFQQSALRHESPPILPANDKYQHEFHVPYAVPRPDKRFKEQYDYASH
ncbi:hypothetical protein Hypma_011083 [Hypsizygus marmoreus]|uniref:Uncharacterized protein n=1 Tax=Hypsizygus marmoreus TaxID=39966 RepID=A0A369JL64_HYPMA|nr:hypothetical protein Hypma_011083 [Hypsizygus marmoreus]